MNIALDYDGTYTADPDLWESFIDRAYENGHYVFIVTSRHPEIDNNKVLEKLKKTTNGVIFTNYKAKRHYVESQEGIKIDVWIDNDPRGIIEDSDITPEQVEMFREHERRYPHV